MSRVVKTIAEEAIEQLQVLPRMLNVGRNNQRRGFRSGICEM